MAKVQALAFLPWPLALALWHGFSFGHWRFAMSLGQWQWPMAMALAMAVSLGWSWGDPGAISGAVLGDLGAIRLRSHVVVLGGFGHGNWPMAMANGG